MLTTDFKLGLIEKYTDMSINTLTARKGTTSITILIINSPIGVLPYTGAPIERKFA